MKLKESVLKIESHETMDLESLLSAIETFGYPDVSRFEYGWHCAISTNTIYEPSGIKSMSEFDCKTPVDAVRQAFERFRQILKDIGVI